MTKKLDLFLSNHSRFPRIQRKKNVLNHSVLGLGSLLTTRFIVYLHACMQSTAYISTIFSHPSWISTHLWLQWRPLTCYICHAIHVLSQQKVRVRTFALSAVLKKWQVCHKKHCCFQQQLLCHVKLFCNKSNMCAGLSHYQYPTVVHSSTLPPPSKVGGGKDSCSLPFSLPDQQATREHCRTSATSVATSRVQSSQYSDSSVRIMGTTTTITSSGNDKAGVTTTQSAFTAQVDCKQVPSAVAAGWQGLIRKQRLTKKPLPQWQAAPTNRTSGMTRAGQAAANSWWGESVSEWACSDYWDSLQSELGSSPLSPPSWRLCSVGNFAVLQPGGCVHMYAS